MTETEINMQDNIVNIVDKVGAQKKGGPDNILNGPKINWNQYQKQGWFVFNIIQDHN